MKSCDQCRHWYPVLDNEKGKDIYGECRRYPPTQKQNGEIVHVGHKGSEYMMERSRYEIFTAAKMWCGEYDKGWYNE